MSVNYLIQSLDSVPENAFEQVNYNLVQKLADCPFEIIHLSKLASPRLVFNICEEEKVIWTDFLTVG
jgi:hypothetical protein